MALHISGFYTKLDVWGSLGLNFDYDGGPIIENAGPIFFVCLFVFVALRPMSTAMVIAGRSVHLTTLSWAGLSKRLTSNLCTYFRL